MADFNMNDYWETQGQIPTLADVEDGLEAGAGVGLTISNIDRADMGSGAALITIDDNAPGSPINGEVWMKTNSPAGGPKNQPHYYDSNSTQWLGMPIYYSSSEPSTTGLKTGVVWYDQVLKMMRVYRESAYDPAGVEGWHPIAEQYQLWTNKSGGIIAPNRVVVQDLTTERSFKTSTIGKDSTVVGVTLATIASNAKGVIATVAGGAYVDIYCNVTSGNIALGDGIASSTAAGEGRTVGDIAANATGAAGTYRIGTPLGCFAVAQEAVTTATITACRLLGRVGDGATYMKASTSIATFAADLANANWDGGWDPIDVAAYPAAGSNDFVADSKHKPIAAVILNADAAMGTTNAGGGDLTLTLSFGKDASTAMHITEMFEDINNTQEQASLHTGHLIVPTAAGSGTPTVMGNKFYWKGDKVASAGTPIVTHANFRAIGYIY